MMQKTRGRPELPVNAGEPDRLLIVPATDPAGNCPSF
jgi:hypothetical protein